MGQWSAISNGPCIFFKLDFIGTLDISRLLRVLFYFSKKSIKINLNIKTNSGNTKNKAKKTILEVSNYAVLYQGKS